MSCDASGSGSSLRACVVEPAAAGWQMRELLGDA